MSDRKTDLQRAQELGMTLDQFQALVGFDPQDAHPEFVQADQQFEIDEVAEWGTEFQVNRDVEKKQPQEIDHYWPKAPATEEEESLYYGDHIHSKDNVYGLHAHYPGGPLGGGHSHGPQNRLGYHTHRYDTKALQQFMFARPGHMIQLDGAHEHHMNAPDGCHTHCAENFGPAVE